MFGVSVCNTRGNISVTDSNVFQKVSTIVPSTFLYLMWIGNPRANVSKPILL